ncbi:MAG: metal-dependent transcriptional regulator [Atopobiaceae bacterium]|jgi:Mn-dependent DtxR family transcriptional regulator|nr:metal-dependent transcriptional regulator [Atopobiaceae bacterium]MCH4180691.1 metal-dependent transcriptional regulator [Atopobiaceae bacterium]MCH4214708.1 metal-dependent transcriptional regulator [Atopobiaceae bacterium]MCH4229886.1 metal-dependent transcriptional regulator [Atopobiaceae bacterium]MCH4276754.1 metal-dependent transcriptional regulator [Atopobiaceae bacterium]
MREETTSHDLSKANEDYLEAIHRIALDTGSAEVRSVDVAEKLDVSKASVTKALGALKERGLVEQARYGRVTLTPEGDELATDVWRCHRMLRAFLVSDLGVEPGTADAEACLMEHALSHDTMLRWIDYLEGQGLSVDAE